MRPTRALKDQRAAIGVWTQAGEREVVAASLSQRVGTRRHCLIRLKNRSTTLRRSRRLGMSAFGAGTGNLLLDQSITGFDPNLTLIGLFAGPWSTIVLGKLGAAEMLV